VRRLALGIVLVAAIAAPAGAQPGSGWVRHSGPGFSVQLPASWLDASKDRARLLEKTRELASDDPELAAIMDNLLAAGNSNVAVKMIAFDVAPSSLRTGFATNLNVVRERTTLSLARWNEEALKTLTAMSFVVQPVWSQRIHLPAGKAFRYRYKARFKVGEVGGKQLQTSITQYALAESGSAYVLTYTTLPRLAGGYRATFDRSAKSFRFH
jgi:hypothetical protein